MPDLHAIAADVGAIATGKFDGLIAPEVLRAFWALGIQGAASNIRETVAPLSLVGADQGSLEAGASDDNGTSIPQPDEVQLRAGPDADPDTSGYDFEHGHDVRSKV